MNEATRVQPLDEDNRRLLANVYPAEWRNPPPARRYNLVVIGAGTAGLITAAGAAGLGAKVALVERYLMGGDCLNVGCVPSKAIIRSSRAVRELNEMARLGVRALDGPTVDFSAVMARMRRVRAQISEDDSARRYRDQLGVDVFLGNARFSGADTVQVGGTTLRFKKAVIATGARAAHPPVPGLAEAGFLTNETVFWLTTLPPRLAVIGGGPIGCELAQAFRRLGSTVVLLENAGQVLNREDADAAKILQETFVREGVQLELNATITRVERQATGKHLFFTAQGQERSVTVDEILVGAGRAPNVEGLNLEVIGVRYDTQSGVHVNDYLQTANPRIYAAGDVCLPQKFTHVADATARIVIQNALFFGRKKVSALTVPWCTYTDPEIAHVGLSEHDARAKGVAIDTFIRPLSAVQRAILDGDEDGFAKVHVKKGTDQIVGATIVARHAGDMISELTLAMVGKLGLGTIATVIHPYPTQAEAIKQVADAYNRTRLTPRVKKAFQTFLAWTR